MHLDFTHPGLGGLDDESVRSIFDQVAEELGLEIPGHLLSPAVNFRASSELGGLAFNFSKVGGAKAAMQPRCDCEKFESRFKVSDERLQGTHVHTCDPTVIATMRGATDTHRTLTNKLRLGPKMRFQHYGN